MLIIEKIMLECKLIKENNDIYSKF
jgi:hypothetical protein